MFKWNSNVYRMFENQSHEIVFLFKTQKTQSIQHNKSCFSQGCVCFIEWWNQYHTGTFVDRLQIVKNHRFYIWLIWQKKPFGMRQRTNKKRHVSLRLFLNPNGKINWKMFIFETPRFACTLNFKTCDSEGMDSPTFFLIHFCPQKLKCGRPELSRNGKVRGPQHVP